MKNTSYITKSILLSCTVLAAGCGGHIKEIVEIIAPVNQPPVVEAGEDVTTFGKKVVTLSGTASDPDGSIVNVVWMQDAADALQIDIMVSGNDISFELPDIYSEETLNFKVTVTDDEGTETSDNVVVTVKPAEHSLSVAVTGFGNSIQVTNQSMVTIDGALSSDYDLKSLVLANQTSGTSVDIDPSEIWQAIVDLVEGDNNFLITAISADDTAIEYDFIVTYDPDMDFTTPLQFDNTALYVGEPAQDIVVTIGTPNANAPTVKLIDMQGMEIAEFADNGVLPDEIQGDGIFTAQFSAEASEFGEKCYRASVTDTVASEYQSEAGCIWGLNSYTSTQVNTTVTLADEVEAKVDSYLGEGKSLNEAAQLTFQDFQDDERMAQSGVTPEAGLWWVSPEGLLGLYHPIVDGLKTGGGRGGVVAPPPVRKADFTPAYYAANRRVTASDYLPFGKSENPFMTETGDGENRIESTRSVIISPFIDNPDTHSNNSFGNTDDYFSVWQTIEQADTCKITADDAFINNGNIGVSLDNFKDFSKYGYIHFSTHGDNYYNGLFTLWEDEWGPNGFLKGNLSIVGLYTGIALPRDEDGDYDATGYETDLQLKRLAIGPGGLLVVLPSFFQHYLTSVPNSLVSLSACRTMYNNSLANVFLAKGAGAVLGYDDYVLSSYAQNTTNTILTDMIDNDSTFGEAVTLARSTHGNSDGGSDDAFLLTAGANDLRLADGSFRNLGFEDGQLSVWQKDGDGRVISQLGSTLPTSGDFVGIISTGLGFTTQSGALSQQACLPETATSLTFNWNFFSEEFLEYCDSQFDDAFSVRICNEENTTCASFETSVNQICTENSVTPSDIGFDQGGVFDTGWRENAIDITALAGDRVTLTLSSTDVGDSIYDTAILLDDIAIE